MVSRLAKFVLSIIVLDMVVIAIVAVVGLLGGLRTLRGFGVPLEIGGVLVIMLSAGSIMGDDVATRSASYRYAQSVTDGGVQKPVEFSPGHRLVNFAEFFKYVLAGGIVLMLGLFASG